MSWSILRVFGDIIIENIKTRRIAHDIVITPGQLAILPPKRARDIGVSRVIKVDRKKGKLMHFHRSRDLFKICATLLHII